MLFVPKPLMVSKILQYRFFYLLKYIGFGFLSVNKTALNKVIFVIIFHYDFYIFYVDWHNLKTWSLFSGSFVPRNKILINISTYFIDVII